MDTPWIQIVSQCGVYITFAIYLVWSVRRGAADWAPVVSAVGYAVVFEHFNMLRYAGSQGGYHYHSHSWIWLWGDVPLYIPLAWAFILATSRAITDQLRMPRWARPFSDALLALLIDVSMDAVAIRLGFWYWHGVRLNQGFFGVPADNFVGWLLVSFTFSGFTRALWQTGETAAGPEARLDRTRVGIVKQIVAIPPLAYVAYLALEAIVHLQYHLFSANTLEKQLWVLGALVAVFLSVVFAGLIQTELRAKAAPAVHQTAVHGPRHIFHAFGLLGMLCVPAAVRSPALWALTAAVWLVEGVIAVYAGTRAARTSERNM